MYPLMMDASIFNPTFILPCSNQVYSIFPKMFDSDLRFVSLAFSNCSRSIFLVKKRKPLKKGLQTIKGIHYV